MTCIFLKFFFLSFQGENFIACEESCPLMKYHDHPELIDDLVIIFVIDFT